jgi:hypothetical protein
MVGRHTLAANVGYRSPPLVVLDPRALGATPPIYPSPPRANAADYPVLASRSTRVEPLLTCTKLEELRHRLTRNRNR